MKTYMCIILAAVGLSSPVLALIDYQWVDPEGGSFSDPNNWLPEGNPGPNDLATFGIPSTYPVFLDTDWTVARLMVDNGQLDLDLGSHRLDLVWTEPTDDAAVVGHISAGKLLLTNGSVYSGSVNLGRNPGAFGALHVSSGGFWEARRDPDWQGIWIGVLGDAHMTVDSGGMVRQGHGAAAAFPGSSGTITVTGGSTWYVDGWFGMGFEGKSALFVENDAYARAGRSEMGFEAGSQAWGIVRNGGVWELTTGWEISLTIGQRGSASLEVIDGGHLLNWGYLAIGSEPGGSGLLVVRQASAISHRSLGIGGTIDGPGGWGKVRVESGGELTIGTNGGDIVSIWPKGTLVVDSGAVVQSAGSDYDFYLYLEGQLTGAGLLRGHLSQFNGKLIPQIDPSNPTALQLTGNYTLDDPGMFVAALEASYQGLQIEGSAVLDGRLQVQLAEGYQPRPDEVISILTAAGGVSGQFRNAPSTITFDRGTFDVTYTGDTVQLTGFRSMPFCDASLPGDLNEDCRVDLLDLSLMAQNWLRCNLVPVDLCQPQ